MKDHRKNRLAEWRRSSGRTVRDCAAEIGVARPTWYSWEKGKNIPSAPLMARLLAMTGGAVTANDFYELSPAGEEAA